MKTKTILWSVVLILIIGIAAAAVWWLLRPQVITFSDDSKVTLLSVEYGKRHAPPTVKAATTSTNRAPARARGNSFTTSNDTLVVWVRQEYDSKQYHGFQYYAYDKAGTACVGNFTTHYANTGRRNGNDVVGIEFNAFPRRQGKFLVGVQEQSSGGQEISDQKYVISNPARGPFTKWTAEPLPATKEDEDLSITMTKLTSGADIAINRNQDNPDDPVNKGVQAVLHVERDGKPVTNWEPVSVETSDATGNRVKVARIGQNGWQNGWGNNAWANDEDTFAYQWGLWPDETAWKIKFEFSQQSDFAANELWTVQNIPLQPGRQQDFNNSMRNSRTNTAVAETDLNGFHLKISQAKQFTDVSPNAYQQGGLLIQVNPDLTEDMRLTLVKLTDDQSYDIGHSDYGTYRNNNVTTYRFGLRDLAGATNLNLTIALHKSRFVEFTAKPEKAADAAAQ
jgi:hypothetical protein